VEFFLEYDTGTEPLTRVAGKLHDYTRLATATAITTPILFWFPTPARESTARAALASTLAALDRPAAVPVATTSADPHRRGAGEHARLPDSPAAARWLPLTAHRVVGDRLGGTGARSRLSSLVWPRTSSLNGTTAYSVASIDPGPAAGVPAASGRGVLARLAEPAPMPPAGQPAYTTRPAPATGESGRSGDPRARR
jgi:hypothetical protein